MKTKFLNIPIEISIITYTNHELIDSYNVFIKGNKGAILVLPFYSNDCNGDYTYKGYLFYHDKESKYTSENDLRKISLQTYLSKSLSGMADNLEPLPYKLVNKDNVMELVECLIKKNTKINLCEKL